MNMFTYGIVDSQNIRLYIGDILVDDFGSEWVLLEDEDILPEDNERFLFFLLNGTTGNKMTERLPISDAKNLKLKYKKVVY